MSSSEAHLRVTSSALFAGRPERAQRRLRDLQAALLSCAGGELSAWREVFEICWAEFWDMHALFETSRPSFGYMTGETVTRVSNACAAYGARPAMGLSSPWTPAPTFIF
ncbi:MAG: hypothetical protein HC902_11360 [Calothrix sp. SM1_5_4]|nr:hypothetical protein [Calothrix sp. SM1_5_4]